MKTFTGASFSVQRTGGPVGDTRVAVGNGNSRTALQSADSVYPEEDHPGFSLRASYNSPS